SSPVAALIARSPASRLWTVLSWCRLSMSRRSRVTCCSGLSRDSFQIAVSAPLKAGPLRQPAFDRTVRGIGPPPPQYLTDIYVQHAPEEERGRPALLIHRRPDHRQRRGDGHPSRVGPHL